MHRSCEVGGTMKEHLKLFGYWVLAEVLTLFIDLTLSFSGNPLVRCICAVCTLGILTALMVQGGYTAALADKKAHITPNFTRPFTLGLTGSAVPLLLTLLLTLSKAGVLPDGFYRIYKLLCAPFLSVCNLMCADVVTSLLPGFGLAVLFLLSLLPIPAVCIAYTMTMQGKSPDDLMIKK